MIKTRAAVLHSINEDLVVENLEVSGQLSLGQVLVKMHSSAICGSQLGEINGIKGNDIYLPHLLGHEGVGTVLQTFEGSKKLKKGDRVIAHWIKGSGLDSPPIKYFSSNLGIVNAGPIAVFGDKVIVAENRLTRIYSEESNDLFSTLGCGFFTAYGVLNYELNLSRKSPNEILILGFGGIGQLIYLIGSINPNNIFSIVDKNSYALQLAKDYSIRNTYENSNQIDIGRYTHVIDTTGIPSLIEAGFESLSLNGEICLVGVTKAGEKISIDPMPLHYGKKIHGSFGGRINPDLDLPKITELVKENIDHFKQFRIKSFELDDINVAIREMRNDHAFSRAVINF